MIIEPAHPVRIIPLLMAAYQLSGREQDVTRLLLQGQSTAKIAETLCISSHTVEDHLKTVLDKTSVRSRRDLVGKICFNHHELRVRDNEDRAHTDLPRRGGPIPQPVSRRDEEPQADRSSEDVEQARDVEQTRR